MFYCYAVQCVLFLALVNMVSNCISVTAVCMKMQAKLVDGKEVKNFVFVLVYLCLIWVKTNNQPMRPRCVKVQTSMY